MTVTLLDPASSPSYPILLAQMDGLQEACEALTIAVRSAEAKARELEAKLNRINKIIYGVGAPLGSGNYFEIRRLATDSPPSGGADGK